LFEKQQKAIPCETIWIKYIILAKIEVSSGLGVGFQTRLEGFNFLIPLQMLILELADRATPLT
jgi:hypothetical protein